MTKWPGDMADALARLLLEQDDVISRRQAIEVMPEAKLRSLVNTGRWTRPHHGLYVAHNGPITSNQRMWIGVLAGGRGRRAPLAGQSALTAHGLRGYADIDVHVLIPARSRDTDPPWFVRVHRTGHLPRIDYVRALPPRTTIARAAIDAASWAPSVDRARAIIAAVFQQRLVTEDEMNAVLARTPRARRRSLIFQTARDAAGGSHSITELDFLGLCRRGRLPEPTRQSTRTDEVGRVRYRDAYFDPWQVHVEIDGGQHVEVAAWWADMKRQNEMWIAGDRVLRFPAWAIRSVPDEVVAQVRNALIAAGWPGEPNQSWKAATT